jgi:hypothetical protein
VKILEKNKSVGIASAARLCHEHNMSATTNKFSLRKQNGLRKPETFCKTFDCYHLNPARTRTLSVLPGPGPALGPGRAEALARVDPCSSHRLRHCSENKAKQGTACPTGF